MSLLERSDVGGDGEKRSRMIEMSFKLAATALTPPTASSHCWSSASHRSDFPAVLGCMCPFTHFYLPFFDKDHGFMSGG